MFAILLVINKQAVESCWSGSKLIFESLMMTVVSLRSYENHCEWSNYFKQVKISEFSDSLSFCIWTWKCCYDVTETLFLLIANFYKIMLLLYKTFAYKGLSDSPSLFYGKGVFRLIRAPNWFFLGRDFAVRTVGIETIHIGVFFVFESRQWASMARVT